MDDLSGLLDFAKTPTGQGLLASVAGGLSGARRGTPWNNVGRAGLAGLAGYSNAMQTEGAQELREIQLQKYKADNLATQQKRDAISRITEGREKDPKYLPSFADLASIDTSYAVKSMVPEGVVDVGLEPKVGINPATGKTGFFVQDKRGGTRWLDAAVPPDFQLVPGNEYKAPTVFNRREGQFAEPLRTLSNLPTPLSQTPAQAQEPQVDTNAPWSKITSPKEQDQMRGRVFEQDNKRLDDLRAKVTNGRSIMNDLERFGQLNRQQGTGGLWNNIPLPTTDDQKKEMESITARLAPAQRTPGAGSSSDSDINLYLRGLPGIEKTGNVNKAIRDGYKKQLTDAESNLSFMEKYLSEKGYLNGAEDARKTAIGNGKSGGLDTSKLTPEQAAYLQQQDPEAFQRGLNRQSKNSDQPETPKQKAANVFDNLPKAISFKGITIKDNQTGKLLRSNGMSWVEVK